MEEQSTWERIFCYVIAEGTERDFCETLGPPLPPENQRWVKEQWGLSLVMVKGIRGSNCLAPSVRLALERILIATCELHIVFPTPGEWTGFGHWGCQQEMYYVE